MKKLVLLVPLLFCGCLPVKVNVEKVVEEVNFDQKDLETVKVGFKSVSKEDARLLFIFFEGAASYVENCEGANLTGELFGTDNSHLNKVEEDYGYSKEKYPDLTDTVFDYLSKGGYTDPNRKIADYRDDLSKRFHTLAEAAKARYEGLH